MGVSGRSAGKWLPAHSPSSQAALTPRRPHPHSLAACAPPANPEELQAVRERRVGPACRTRKGRKTEREGTLAILLMYKRTKVRPCVVRPCWVALLGDVNRRCPEDDLAPTRLLPAQPLEVLEHRPISCHNPIRIRSEVPADPTLNSRGRVVASHCIAVSTVTTPKLLPIPKRIAPRSLRVFPIFNGL